MRDTRKINENGFVKPLFCELGSSYRERVIKSRLSHFSRGTEAKDQGVPSNRKSERVGGGHPAPNKSEPAVAGKVSESPEKRRRRNGEDIALQVIRVRMEDEKAIWMTRGDPCMSPGTLIVNDKRVAETGMHNRHRRSMRGSQRGS